MQSCSASWTPGVLLNEPCAVWGRHESAWCPSQSHGPRYEWLARDGCRGSGCLGCISFVQSWPDLKFFGPQRPWQARMSEILKNAQAAGPLS